MRWLLLFAVLLAGPMRGQEATAPSMKEKLRARIREALPASSPTRPAEGRPEPADPVFVLEKMVVAESRAVRELGQQLVADKQRQEAEAFSPLKGGTIYRSDRLELGAWWTPENGWHFLKLKW